MLTAINASKHAKSPDSTCHSECHPVAPVMHLLSSGKGSTPVLLATKCCDSCIPVLPSGHSMKVLSECFTEVSDCLDWITIDTVNLSLGYFKPRIHQSFNTPSSNPSAKHASQMDTLGIQHQSIYQKNNLPAVRLLNIP